PRRVIRPYGSPMVERSVRKGRGSTALLRSPIRADRRHALRLSLDGNAGRPCAAVPSCISRSSKAQQSIAWAEINGLAHVPVAATEAKLVRLPRLIAPMRAGDPITPHGRCLSFGQL